MRWIGARPAMLFLAGMLFVATVAPAPPAANAQTGADPNEWRFYGGDPGHTKYTSLDQITEDNVDQLRIAWIWTSVDEKLRAENPVIGEGRRFRTYAYEVTPLVVDGVLYTTTNLGQVAAIDPTTGETIWSYDPGLYLDGRPAVHGFLTRGLSWWSDGEEARLLYAGGRTWLVSVDAKTGKPDPAFGRNGRVDLTRGLGRTIDTSQYAVSSAPLVAGDTIVVGSAITEGTGRKEAPPGHVRGYDVRTGEMKWIFHTIPQPGEFGHETWGNESWKWSGGANVWSNMSADPELGYVYLPVGSPVTDYYGGHRPGDNLFANSLVCLDAETGERVWHFQFVHHAVWDYDLPAAPNLIDITVDGRKIEAVAQITKQGFTFVFDRATGEPVWPIEERPVPPSTVPGERTSPTQPYPTKPPLYLTNGSLEADLIDFTDELRAEALEIYREHTAGPLYTPPALGGNIVRPGWSGGANWWGAAFDPETGRLYVPSWAHFSFVVLEAGDPANSDLTIRPQVSNLPGPRGTAALQAALLAARGAGHERRREAVERAARRRPPQPRGAARHGSAPARQLREERRPAADENAALYRPGHRVEAPARVRQGHRLRAVRDGAPRAVIVRADQLPGGRPAVHRPGGRRRGRPRAARRAGPSVDSGLGLTSVGDVFMLTT